MIYTVIIHDKSCLWFTPQTKHPQIKYYLLCYLDCHLLCLNPLVTNHLSFIIRSPEGIEREGTQKH